MLLMLKILADPVEHYSFSSSKYMLTFTFHFITGVYKQWNGLLDWNTGLDWHIFGFYTFLVVSLATSALRGFVAITKW